MQSPDLSFVYGIGKKGHTKEYSFYNPKFLEPLKKQINRSVPVITSITLKARSESEKQDLFTIYVGKELSLKNFNEYYINKYDIDTEELERYKDAGYDRVCLLNYKKYDSIIIGLNKQDKVVPDYYALKRNLLKLVQLQQKLLEV